MLLFFNLTVIESVVGRRYCIFLYQDENLIDNEFGIIYNVPQSEQMASLTELCLLRMMKYQRNRKVI